MEDIIANLGDAEKKTKERQHVATKMCTAIFGILFA